MLLAILCQACFVARPVDALTPYFEGQVSRERLTIDAPCPRGTELRWRGERTAICFSRERPRDELIVDFHPADGTLHGYATSIEGYAHGIHRNWHRTGIAEEMTTYVAGKRHGRHRVRASNGDDVLVETFVDDLRHGEYTTWSGKQRRDHGFYIRGLKEGRWEEWIDGRLFVREYSAGTLIVNGPPIAAPAVATPLVDAAGTALEPSPHVPTAAQVAYTALFKREVARHHAFEQVPARYQALVGVVDLAWLGLAIYGHYHDNTRAEIAGGIGLVVSAPLLHAWRQHSDQRRDVVVKSLALRPVMVGGVLLIYSAGKFFAGLDCKSTNDPDNGTHSCGEVDLNFNSHYSWNGVALASAIAIVSIDLLQSTHRRQSTRQLGVMPVSKGSGVMVSGSF